MNKITSITAIALACFLTVSASAQNKTIVETAINAGNFKTLVTAVKAAGLVETLNGHKKFHRVRSD